MAVRVRPLRWRVAIAIAELVVLALIGLAVLRLMAIADGWVIHAGQTSVIPPGQVPATASRDQGPGHGAGACVGRACGPVARWIVP